MPWNYRVVRYIERGIADEGIGETYAIHEAYYASDELRPPCITEEPSRLVGTTLEELQASYDRMGEAFGRPVLDWESFGDSPSKDGKRVRMRRR
jgi:hypothetical protein